ncbi:MAG: inositol monophosphatase family protein [Armatimonadota bacterium]
MNDQFLQVAVNAALASGKLQREAFGAPPVIREATQYDIKLQTDVDCEEVIRTQILHAFPDHAILAEEGGGSLSADQPTWIIDPLDGTVNFARQVPHFCTSIALYSEGRSIVGVVYDPIIDELYTTQEGGGAFLNGKPIHVSQVAGLTAANVGVGFAKSVETLACMLEEMNELARAVRKIRIMGAAALDMAYVAAGRFDGFMEFGLRSWDITAGTLLILEAGGRVQLSSCGEYAWDVRADNGSLW